MPETFVMVNSGAYDSFNGKFIGQGALQAGEDYLHAISKNGELPTYFLRNTQRPTWLKITPQDASSILRSRRMTLQNVLFLQQEHAVSLLEQVSEEEAKKELCSLANERAGRVKEQMKVLDEMHLALFSKYPDVQNI